MMNIETIAQNKLLILYLLKTINIQLSELQILRTVTENNWLNYFDLKECMFELMESNLVEQRETPSGTFYAITELGRTTLYYLEKELLNSQRRAIDDYCNANRDELRLETELFAEYIKIDEGEYKVMLKVLENQVPVFELSLITYSQASAESFIRKWKRVAPRIYKNTYDELME
jgi:predicted transcriptional regulator